MIAIAFIYRHQELLNGNISIVCIYAKTVKEFRVAAKDTAAEDARMRSILAILLSAIPLSAAHWNKFRGPQGNGHVNGELPLTWNETENVKWKTPIPGRG